MTNATANTKRSGWLVPAGLVLLSVVPALGGAVRLASLSQPQITPDNARFMASPLPILLQIGAAIPFAMIGAFQFSAEFRRRYRNLHRAAGRVLVVLGLIAAISGIWMTLTYPWGNNDGVAVYIERLVFGFGMFACMVMGIDAIRRRDFTEHGSWMLRAYAIGMGAGTQVLTHLPYFILVGKPDELGRAIMMGAGWVINVILAEVVIYRQSTRTTVRKQKKVFAHAS
jgi:uncharacterized membrane protein